MLFYGENTLGRDTVQRPLAHSGVTYAERTSQLGGGTPAAKVIGQACHIPNDSPICNSAQAPLSPNWKLALQTASVEEEQFLGDRLRAARDRVELTQEAAADILGITHAAIGSWERREAIPTLENLVACATAYSASLDWLVHGMGYNFDERVAALHPTLRDPLIDRIAKEIADAERLMKQLPAAFSPEPIKDTDRRLKKWSALNQIKRDKIMGGKKGGTQ